jgi:lysophospholipase L1-like esterase
MRLRRFLLGSAFTVIAGGAAMAYTVARVQSRATGDVAEYLAGPPAQQPPVVVAGASIVRGRAAVDFVQILRERFPQRAFVNAGVNSNIAQQLLNRLDPIMECQPAEVVILIGTNDVEVALATPPEIFHGYAQSMTDIVTKLQSAGIAVALCSLPPIGQDLSAQVNRDVRAANAVLREVAYATQATYLPVYERLSEFLDSQGKTDGPAWTGSWAPGLLSLTEHFILHRSYDSISAARGWLLSPDGVHMNTTGATLIADVIEEWLVSRSQ